MTALVFVIILGILVFVHELGHFLVARWSKIHVEEFGFGFPPRLFSIKRPGGLLLSVNAIPFGGFVRLQGEQHDPDHRPGSFISASWPQQLAVLAAGVIMNYLLAWFLLTTVFAAGTTIPAADVPASAQSYLHGVHQEAVVAADSPASRAGLRSGDRIISINGQRFSSTADVITYTTSKDLPVLEIDAQHQNVERVFTVRPQAGPADQPHYGFGIESFGRLQYPWYRAPLVGVSTTVSISGQTVVGFGHLLRDLIVHGQVSGDLTGPVGIAVLTGQVSRLGFLPLLQFMAVLSISLAVVNFLPLPALDGGRAVFVVIARLRGRPLNHRVESIIHTVGFYALISLVIAITIRDVHRFDIVPKVLRLFH